MNDARIVVLYERGKTIAEIICKEITASRKENSKHYELCARCEKAYQQITKWQDQGKVCNVPFNDAADFYVPLIEWTVDAVVSRVVSVLFSQEPYMQASGVEGSDVDKADGVTTFTDTILREVVKLREFMEFYIKQIIKLPFAVAKYEWVDHNEPMIVKEKVQVYTNPMTGQQQQILPDSPDAMLQKAELIANGYQMQPELADYWVMKQVEIENQAKFQYIRADDYVFSHTAKRGTRLYWEGDRIWLTFNDMRLKAQQEQFIPEAVDKIITDNLTSSGSTSEKAIASRSVLRECYNWYGRLPFNRNNEIDFEAQDAIEQEVIAVVDLKAEELLQIKHWDNSRLPFPDRVYLRGEFEETENFEGRSLVMKLLMTQDYLNQLYNTIMNNAWLSMQKIFVLPSTASNDEAPKVYPGAQWYEDVPGSIRALEVGDVKIIGLELQQLFINFAERISNISIYQTGTARTEGGGKTKGEVDATIAEGNIGMDRFIQNIHGILKKVCQWTLSYYRDRMPLGMERKILGEDGSVIMPTQNNMATYQQKGIQPYWTPDDLTGKFDFTWNGTSLNSDKQWKIAVANDLMDRYLKIPMVGGNLLYTWEICKQGLIARGQKDWQKYLPKREAIIAEMQNIEAEAQARRVINKSGAGMDPQAQALIRQRIENAKQAQSGNPAAQATA